MTDLTTSLYIAASGMKAQSERLKVAAQNIANSSSTGSTPGSEPYQRKTITFENELNRELGVDMVKVKEIGRDDSDFKRVYNPSHVAANAEGYVLMPNVSTIIESTDASEAQRSYEANLNTIEVTKTMLRNTLELLR